MDDNERAVQRIHQMCGTIESLGQELQDARRWAAAWKESARANHDAYHDAHWNFNESMRQYNAQQKRACDAEERACDAEVWAAAWKGAAKHWRRCELLTRHWWRVECERNKQLIEENERLRGALVDVEWACDDRYCPACGGYPEQGHNMWCDLAAVLKATDDA